MMGGSLSAQRILTLWNLRPAHPMSWSSGLCGTSVPTPAPSREQLCSPRELSLPQGLGQQLLCLCLSPGLKQAGKAPLKFAATCGFLGLEIPSKPHRRKVVSASLLSQSHSWALNTCGSPAQVLWVLPGESWSGCFSKLSESDHCLGGWACQLPLLQHQSNYIFSSPQFSIYSSSDAFTPSCCQTSCRTGAWAKPALVWGVQAQPWQGLLWSWQQMQLVLLTSLNISFPRLNSEPKLHPLLIFSLLAAQAPFKARQSCLQGDLQSSTLRSTAWLQSCFWLPGHSVAFTSHGVTARGWGLPSAPWLRTALATWADYKYKLLSLRSHA